MRFLNPHDFPVGFRIRKENFLVVPGGSVEVPNAFAYVIKAENLPLVPDVPAASARAKGDASSPGNGDNERQEEIGPVGVDPFPAQNAEAGVEVIEEGEAPEEDPSDASPRGVSDAAHPKLTKAERKEQARKAQGK